MKIAIPTKGTIVDNHFGQCSMYAILTTDENKNFIQYNELKTPEGCACKADIASILKQKGVSVILAGNMGSGVYNDLTSKGIKVFRGNSGDIFQLVENYLEGQVNDSPQVCATHEWHMENELHLQD